MQMGDLCVGLGRMTHGLEGVICGPRGGEGGQQEVRGTKLQAAPCQALSWAFAVDSPHSRPTVGSNPFQELSERWVPVQPCEGVPGLCQPHPWVQVLQLEYQQGLFFIVML